MNGAERSCRGRSRRERHFSGMEHDRAEPIPLRRHLGGMERKSSSPSFFTERSLAAYLPSPTARSATGSGAESCPATSSAPPGGSTQPTSRTSSRATGTRRHEARVADQTPQPLRRDRVGGPLHRPRRQAPHRQADAGTAARAPSSARPKRSERSTRPTGSPTGPTPWATTSPPGPSATRARSGPTPPTTTGSPGSPTSRSRASPSRTGRCASCAAATPSPWSTTC